jgi:hypothetical protein
MQRVATNHWEAISRQHKLQKICLVGTPHGQVAGEIRAQWASLPIWATGQGFKLDRILLFSMVADG